VTFVLTADSPGDSVQATTTGRLAVITVTGDVDVMNAGALRESLLEQFTAGVRHFVLDLSAVSFLDSTGLGVLVATHRRTRNGAGSLRLVVTGKQLLQLLRMTGLNSVFRVYPSLEEALDATYVDHPEVREPAIPAARPVPPRTPISPAQEPFASR
jgi:anti-sigma B factor antagonist